MHKLLLWRLGLELWNLLALLYPLLPQRGPLGAAGRWLGAPVVNFAFGANLDPAVLRRRSVRPLQQEDFLLRNHVLRFNQAGPFKGFGFASVEAAPQGKNGARVFGRLLTLRRVDAVRMDYFELVPLLHKHRKVIAEQDGQRFFFYQATWPIDHLRPTREYLNRILQAAEQSPLLAAEELTRLQAIEALEVLEPPDAFNFLVRDHKAPPRVLAPLRRRYDSMAVRLFQFLNGLRLVQPLLPVE